MKKRRMLCAVLVIQLLLVCCANQALAYKTTTLRPGKTYSEEVKTMQAALISLGYLGGTPDGLYGNNTERAVKAFQKANGLTADGLAGTATLTKLYALAGSSRTASEQEDTSTGDSTGAAAQEDTSAPQEDTGTAAREDTSAQDTGTSQSTASSGLFNGNYATIRIRNTGSRVRLLQQALISLGYLKGSADGIFGVQTRQAVIAFQKSKGLTTDGLAGKKTLTALEKALGSGSSASTEADESTTGSDSSDKDPAGSTSTASTSVGNVKLLHWFNDIKPTIRSGQNLLIVDPSSGLTWTLRLYSLGRHADAEPLTAQDTANMLEAFGGKNTWSQKAVYVKLPTGIWTIGSTHDMPHMSGSISDNNFNGHLCVHFLRDMDECTQNDPNYGVSNQKTIRAFWKSLTGEEVE